MKDRKLEYPEKTPGDELQKTLHGLVTLRSFSLRTVSCACANTKRDFGHTQVCTCTWDFGQICAFHPPAASCQHQGCSLYPSDRKVQCCYQSSTSPVKSECHRQRASLDTVRRKARVYKCLGLPWTRSDAWPAYTHALVCPGHGQMQGPCIHMPWSALDTVRCKARIYRCLGLPWTRSDARPAYTDALVCPGHGQMQDPRIHIPWSALDTVRCKTLVYTGLGQTKEYGHTLWSDVCTADQGHAGTWARRTVGRTPL